MKPKKLTFQQFHKECMDYYEHYRHHYNMHNIRIMDHLAGDTREGVAIYYCIWSLRHGCDMVLMYDSDSDDSRPFITYVDWRRHSCGSMYFLESGQFVMLGDFEALSLALHTMVIEPNMYIAARHHVCDVWPVPDKSKGETLDDMPCVVLEGCTNIQKFSFLEVLDAIYKDKASPYSPNKGKRIKVVHDFDYNKATFDTRIGDYVGYTGDVLYETIL